jgi:hypothetical protein
MIENWLGSLCRELGLQAPKREGSLWILRIGPESVVIQDLKPGFSLQAEICPCPGRGREDLFMHLMRANFMGQGASGGRIGMDGEGKSLTLSFGMPYEGSQKAFYESIESFVNYLKYWREEVKKYEQGKR